MARRFVIPCRFSLLLPGTVVFGLLCFLHPAPRRSSDLLARSRFWRSGGWFHVFCWARIASAEARRWRASACIAARFGGNGVRFRLLAIYLSLLFDLFNTYPTPAGLNSRTVPFASRSISVSPIRRPALNARLFCFTMGVSASRGNFGVLSSAVRVLTRLLLLQSHKGLLLDFSCACCRGSFAHRHFQYPVPPLRSRRRRSVSASFRQTFASAHCLEMLLTSVAG